MNLFKVMQLVRRADILSKACGLPLAREGDNYSAETE